MGWNIPLGGITYHWGVERTTGGDVPLGRGVERTIGVGVERTIGVGGWNVQSGWGVERTIGGGGTYHGGWNVPLGGCGTYHWGGGGTYHWGRGVERTIGVVVERTMGVQANNGPTAPGVLSATGCHHPKADCTSQP